MVTLLKKKPQKKLEELRIEYAILEKQRRRNVEAKQLEGKIFAIKHPMLVNIGQNIAASQKGKGKKGNAWAALADIDKRIIK